MIKPDNRPLSLYLHFPFCVRKCRYCDFLSFPSDEEMRDIYLIHLEKEIAMRRRAYRNHVVKTVFLGGGTPSLMTGEQLERIMNHIRLYYNVDPSAEITMECNPGTVDAEKLRAYKAAGINRLSFGLQSMNDAELTYLGRIHTAETFIANYQEARRAGFDNINVDLMSALPGQTIEGWKDTLEKVIALDPEHISAYSLIIEEGTPFWNMYGEDAGEQQCLALPDEDTEREMYHLTKSVLAEHGYLQYETSNYAKPGKECQHNLTYWYRGDYLGFGLGAASMTDNTRFSNTRDMQTYLVDLEYAEEEDVDRKGQMEETMFLGLRCIKGISIRKFEEDFGCSVMSVYSEIIEKYQKQGFLILDEAEDRMYLTDTGMDVSNWILSDFLL